MACGILMRSVMQLKWRSIVKLCCGGLIELDCVVEAIELNWTCHTALLTSCSPDTVCLMKHLYIGCLAWGVHQHAALNHSKTTEPTTLGVSSTLPRVGTSVTSTLSVAPQTVQPRAWINFPKCTRKVNRFKASSGSSCSLEFSPSQVSGLSGGMDPDQCRNSQVSASFSQRTLLRAFCKQSFQVCQSFERLPDLPDLSPLDGIRSLLVSDPSSSLGTTSKGYLHLETSWLKSSLTVARMPHQRGVHKQPFNCLMNPKEPRL